MEKTQHKDLPCTPAHRHLPPDIMDGKDADESPVGFLLGFGHPLLDIIADVDSEFLKKYGLKEDDVILGSEAHANLVEDLISSHKVQFTAGGAAQNTLRVAQWTVGRPGFCSFVGSVGRDLFAGIMKDSISREGIQEHYVEVVDKPSGKCAVLISKNGLCRSLVSFPGAARSISKDTFPWHAVHAARIVYTSAFTITSGFDVVLEIGNHCRRNRKLFCINLAAKYVAEKQVEKLRQLLPLTDLLFGNDGEMRAFADAMQMEGKLEEIMVRLAASSDGKRDRVVVATRGTDPILVATASGIESFAVPGIQSKDVVDTNGAGDAFVGGFLAYLSQFWLTEHEEPNEPVRLASNPSLIRRCVEEGIFCSRMIIGIPGCSLDLLHARQHFA